MVFHSRIAPCSQVRFPVSFTSALMAWGFVLLAHASSQLTQTVEYTPSPRGHLLVPVSINGSEPLVFALDTAAGATMVTPALAESLALAEVPGERVATLGTHGKTENAVVELKSLTVGEAGVVDVQAVVLDLDHITKGDWRLDGILGMDFLSQFDVRLDFASNTVSLYTAALDRSDCAACPSGLDGVTFETIDPGFIILPATVDGKPVNALLDTGSGHSGLNGEAAAALGVTLPPTTESAPAGHGMALQTGPVAVGGFTLAELATLHVMEHPIMEALGLADSPAMLMGTDQLASRIVTICYGLGTLFLQ